MSDEPTVPPAPIDIPPSKALIRGTLHTNPVFGSSEHGPYAQLSVATVDRFDGKDGPQERTQVHRVVAYGELATSLKEAKLGIGAGVELAGTPRLNSWEKDGIKHRTIEITASALTPTIDPPTNHQNTLILAGTVREPPQISKQGAAQHTMARLSIAVPTIRADGSPTGHADWHTVTCWGGVAESTKRLPVGAAVEIKANLAHKTLDVERGGGAGKAKRYLSELTGFSVRDLSKEQKRDTPPKEKAQGIGL